MIARPLTLYPSHPPRFRARFMPRPARFGIPAFAFLQIRI